MIYKGCEKRMIMIKSTGSDLFEEAYFILNNKGKRTADRTDMVREANRIISRAGLTEPQRPKRKSSMLQFAIGFLSGVGAMGIVMIII